MKAEAAAILIGLIAVYFVGYAHGCGDERKAQRAPEPPRIVVPQYEQVGSMLDGGYIIVRQVVP